MLKRSMQIVVGVALILAFAATPAFAGEALQPWWHVNTGARPSYLPPHCAKVAAGTGRYFDSACEESAVVKGQPTGEYEKGKGQIFVDAANLGDTPADTCVKVAPGTGKFTSANCASAGAGEYEEVPATIEDRLPAGLKFVSCEVNDSFQSGTNGIGKKSEFGEVECQKSHPAGQPETVTATFFGQDQNGDAAALPPYGQIEVRIEVKVEEEATACEPGGSTCPRNAVTVSGAGAREPVSIDRPLTISEGATPFGFQDYEVTPEGEGGAPDTQAGSHPFQTTFTFDVNQGPVGASSSGEPEAEPVGFAKDIFTKLPPGMIGDPSAFPYCTLVEFHERFCPPESVVGAATVRVNEPGVIGLATFTSPIFNMEPATGEPARFAFYPTKETPVFIETSVRSGKDYAVVAGSSNIVQVVGFLRAQLTFWGVPGVAAHNLDRGFGCLETSAGILGDTCTNTEEHNPPPFFVLPTDCTGHPLQSFIEADSWSEPKPVGERLTIETTAPMPTLDGCNKLNFEPQIEVKANGEAASSPTGLDVDVHVPQEAILNGTSLAQANVRNITVALPPGVAINPSSGDGLEACSSGPSPLGEQRLLGDPGDQIGYEGESEFDKGTEPGVKLPAFTPYLPGSYAAKGAAEDGELAGGEANRQPGINFCSNASKIANVKIKTPLLPADQPLEGSVYLAAQEANPFGSLIAMYIVAEDPKSGSLVKLPGEVRLCQGAGEVIEMAKGEPVTCAALGQIVSTFQNNPQLAFEDAELKFFEGERAPLATPTRCGRYTTTAEFEPWSAEASEPPVPSSSTFDITTGPATSGHRNGTPCPGSSLPFSPSSNGGALNLQAGEFSPFTATLNREPGEQNMQSVEVHLPPGLSAILANVELCPEPLANEGKCPPTSLIGETTVSVGVGGEPFTVTGGKFYLTGPYNGRGGCNVIESGCAPFGITFEVPAKAGPYDLANTQHNHPPCDCVLVRGKIEVNQETSAITVTSNPPGTPDSIPTSIEGIPLEIQHINATTTRGSFQFNPTNCNKMEVTGTIESSEKAKHTIGVPFQVTNCGALKYEPKLTVTTNAHTSKADGASLHFKIAYPKTARVGNQAWFKSMKFTIPEQLPARLTTIQKACLAATFEANPAACPSASVIGTAVVHTQLLPTTLSGPLYFVSYGNEKFPEAVLVLQGDGVKLVIHGETYISPQGVTSATFKTIPEAPFETAEVNVPEGPYSEFAANGNLCAETKTVTVKKKITVKVHGHKKTVTRKVKQTQPESLRMPIVFTAADGGTPIAEEVPIGVEGCPKSKAAKKAKKKKKKKGKGGKKGRK